MGPEEGWRRMEGRSTGGGLEEDWNSIFIDFRKFSYILIEVHRFLWTFLNFHILS